MLAGNRNVWFLFWIGMAAFLNFPNPALSTRPATTDPWAKAAIPAREKLVLPVEELPPVYAWNALLLDAFRADREYPPAASRALAILHLSLYDAVNTIETRADYYLGPVEGSVPARREAAIAAAGLEVGQALYPQFDEDWEALHAAHLAALPQDQSTTNGLALGRAAAERLLSARADDGYDQLVAFPGSSEPGAWRPTFPSYRPALSPHWRFVRPFVMESPDEFRLPPPPTLVSDRYTTDLLEVQSIGEFFSDTRTPDQTDIALFWEDAPGTFLPPGHWNQIAVDAARAEGLDPWKRAHLLARLNLALADAAIAAWDSKYTHAYWRPITAISLAADDGNPATEPDANWTSYLVAPAHPEYPSGHSTFNGAGSTILEAMFGPGYAFDSRSDGLLLQYGIPDFSRQYDSFREAAEEGGRSRIYGGIHYEFSNEGGLSLGRAVGELVLEEELQRAPEIWLIR